MHALWAVSASGCAIVRSRGADDLVFVVNSGLKKLITFVMGTQLGLR